MQATKRPGPLAGAAPLPGTGDCTADTDPDTDPDADPDTEPGAAMLAAPWDGLGSKRLLYSEGVKRSPPPAQDNNRIDPLAGASPLPGTGDRTADTDTDTDTDPDPDPDPDPDTDPDKWPNSQRAEHRTYLAQRSPTPPLQVEGA